MLGTWLFLRCLTSLVAAAFSPLYPMTSIEKNMALWPPAHNILCLAQPHFCGALGALGCALVRADPGARLCRLGWHHFFPAAVSLVELAALPAWPGPNLESSDHQQPGSPDPVRGFPPAGLPGSPPATAWTALLLLATFPIAFILFAPYSESLFLVWVALALYAMRGKRWGLVAIFSFLAALTRQQGIFLALPMAWWAWEASGKSLRGIKPAWRAWLTALAAPAGLAAWGIYRIGYLHEGSLDFSNPQGLIYSALLSPSASLVVKGQAFRWPWQAFAMAISKAIHTPEINVFVNLTLGIGFVVAFGVAWKYLNIPERLYSLAIILVSFSVTTGDYAYISLPRHLMLALPVFIGLAAALKKPWQRKTLIAFQIVGAMFLLVLYVFIQLIP